jgi:hypothetical protein
MVRSRIYHYLNPIWVLKRNLEPVLFPCGFGHIVHFWQLENICRERDEDFLCRKSSSLNYVLILHYEFNMHIYLEGVQFWNYLFLLWFYVLWSCMAKKLVYIVENCCVTLDRVNRNMYLLEVWYITMWLHICIVFMI